MDSSQKKESNVLKKNIFWQYLLQIAVYVFPFITLPYLTRVLGPDEYAVRAYSISIMSLLSTIVGFGFTTYGTREVARNRTDFLFIRSLTTSIVIQRFILAFIAGIVLFLIIPSIPIMAANPEYMMISYISMILTAMLPDYIFQGLEDMAILTKRFVVSRLVSIILIFTFVQGPNQLLLVALFEAVPSLIAFIWSWADVVVKRKITPSLKLFEPKKSWNIFKTSTFFFISSASTTIFTNLTTVMIGIYIVAQAEISYWSLASMCISALQSLYTPIYNSIYPHVIAHRKFSLIKRALLIGLPVVIAAIILVIFLSPLAMWILGGPEYVDGSIVLQLLAPLLLFSYPAVLIGFPILAAIDKEKLLTVSSVVAALFHIAGLCAFAYFGCFTIINVAILRCATEFVMLLLRVLFVYKSRNLLTPAYNGSSSD